MRVTDEMVEAAIREWMRHTGVKAVPFTMRPTLVAALAAAPACRHIRSTGEGAHHCALAAAPQAEPVADDRPTWNVPHAVTIRCLRAAEDRIRAGEAPADVFADYGWGFAPDGSATAPQWIACEERMPEAGVEVLVWLAAPVIKYGCQIAIDTWDEQHEAPVAWSSATIPIGEGWDSGADWQDITHWMPLPAAPRSEG